MPRPTAIAILTLLLAAPCEARADFWTDLRNIVEEANRQGAAGETSEDPAKTGKRRKAKEGGPAQAGAGPDNRGKNLGGRPDRNRGAGAESRKK